MIHKAHNGISQQRSVAEMLGNTNDEPAVFTIIENNAGPATKIFWLKNDGTLDYRSAAQIWDGVARQESAADLDEFLAVRQELKPNEALIYGAFRDSPVAIGKQDSMEVLGGAAAARDRAHTSYRKGKPGIWFIDHDPRKGECKRYQCAELDEIIGGFMPEWHEAKRAWTPSASAFIRHRSMRKELIGIGGWRAYALIDDASKIPALTALLYQRLWDNGHGFIEFSDGEHPRRLDRSIIDASVAQPERLDFAATPIMRDDKLERFAPEPLILPGSPMLDTSNMCLDEVPELKTWRKSSAVLQKALADAKPEAGKRLKVYVGRRIAKVKATQPDVSAKRVQQITERAIEHSVLSGDFELTLADGSKKFVREMLADPDRYHEMRLPDPLEPDYRGDKRIAIAYLKPEIGDDPIIFSHAHGGIAYKLKLETAEVDIKTGDQPKTVDDTLNVMRARSDLYERGGLLTRVASRENTLIPVEDAWLQDYLGRCIKYFQWKSINVPGEGPVLVRNAANVPAWLPRQINAKRGEWGLTRLNGLITAPTLREDGSLLFQPGYDKQSGLLLRGGPFPSIPEKPTKDGLEEAFKTLWWPVRLFPYATDGDRGAMLAALLTALIRPSLPQAPAFLFDAAQARSGKTFLGLCCLALAGAILTVQTAESDKDEFRKKLLATLLEGNVAVLFDNVRGEWINATLEAFLTAPNFSDRVLGGSKNATLSTRVFLAVTGNNFNAGGDLFGRLVQTRIDARMADPERRAFPFIPQRVVIARRQEMVAAGLTLLRGFLAAGKPKTTDDRLASFEDWDDTVRQCVLWLAQEGIALTDEVELFGDPIACQRQMKAREPGRQKLAAFHTAVYAVHGSQSWTVKTLLDSIDSIRVLDEKDAEGPLHRLQATLDDIASDRGNKLNPRILGGWLKNNRGARSDDALYIADEGLDKHAKVQRWSVRSDTSSGCTK